MNSLSKQRRLAMMTGFERHTKKTRRAIFLEEMDQVVAWGTLCALIEPYYPKPGNGRRPKELEQMLRIYFVQAVVQLGGPERWKRHGTTRVTLRLFAGIDDGWSQCRMRPRSAGFATWKSTIWEKKFWAR